MFISVTTGLFAQWIPQATGFAAASRGINYIHCVDASVVWATAYDGSGGGLYVTEYTKTTNGGTLWVPGQVLTQTGYGLGNITAIDATTAWAAVFYNGTQNNTCGVYKTTDGGSTWTQQNVLQGASSFANNVYFWDANNGMCHGDLRDGYFEVYTTTDGGTTWTRTPQANFTGVPILSGEGGWTGVIDHTGQNTIIFGTNKGNLYISNDRGLNWVASFTGASASGTNGGINEIAFKDPMHGLVAHVNTSNLYDLYETSDGGVTWQQVNYFGPAYANSLAYVPGTPNTYVCTGAATNVSGCSYSYDGGHTWTEFNGTNGVQFLATRWVDNATGWAGDFTDAVTPSTLGGMYKFNGVLTEILQIDPQKGGVKIYPNPNQGQFTLTIVGFENKEVQIDIFDAIGKVVYSGNENQSLISYNKAIDLAGLPAGIYVASIQCGDLLFRERIVIR